VFHSWMCKRILGRMRETKVTNTELSWLYSALIARQPIDPTHLWSTGGVVSNIEFGRYWFGVLPLHVGYLFKTGYYKEPESSPTGDFPRIWIYEESKYISEDERGGFKVAKVNLPLSDERIRLFVEDDWLEEGLLVPVEKK
jgi:hypothetical protein